MIVRRLQDCIGNEREVKGPTWVSRRMLLKNDRMGFSLHDTILYAGTVTEMEYKHHLESVYCIGGTGELESLVTGERWAIEAGTMYALNKHDRHRLHAHTELRMVCTFNPPLTGLEVHGPDGAYPADPELTKPVAKT